MNIVTRWGSSEDYKLFHILILLPYLFLCASYQISFFAWHYLSRKITTTIQFPLFTRQVLVPSLSLSMFAPDTVVLCAILNQLNETFAKLFSEIGLEFFVQTMHKLPPSFPT